MPLLSATTGATTTFTISSTNCNGVSYLSCQLPCPGFTYTIGCQFHIVIGNSNPYTGTWAAANGNWLATAVSNTSFSISLNSAGFPALPANGTFIFDWLPYGAHIRLKSSFNVDELCSNTSLTDKCPYEKAILNTLQVYGLVLLDGTIPSDNWDSGIVSSEFDPDQLTDAATDLRSNPAFQSIEQYFEVADASGQQIDFTPYTNLNNQIGLTAHNRVTVTMSSPGYPPVFYGCAATGDCGRYGPGAHQHGDGHHVPDKFLGNRKCRYRRHLCNDANGSGSFRFRNRPHYCPILSVGRDQNYSYDH